MLREIREGEIPVRHSGVMFYYVLQYARINIVQARQPH